MCVLLKPDTSSYERLNQKFGKSMTTTLAKMHVTVCNVTLKMPYDEVDQESRTQLEGVMQQCASMVRGRTGAFADDARGTKFGFNERWHWLNLDLEVQLHWCLGWLMKNLADCEAVADVQAQTDPHVSLCRSSDQQCSSLAEPTLLGLDFTELVMNPPHDHSDPDSSPTPACCVSLRPAPATFSVRLLDSQPVPVSLAPPPVPVFLHSVAPPPNPVFFYPGPVFFYPLHPC